MQKLFLTILGIFVFAGTVYGMDNPCIGLDDDEETACVRKMVRNVSWEDVEVSQPEPDVENEANLSESRSSVSEEEDVEPLDFFMQDLGRIKSVEKRVEFLMEVKERGDEAYSRGIWDGSPSWDYPLPHDAIILDDEMAAYVEKSGTQTRSVTLYKCNYNSSSNITWDGNVVVSSNSCTWQGGGTITITGYLHVPAYRTLTIRTTSTTGQSVHVNGLNASNDAIAIYGNLYLQADYLGKYLFLYVAQDGVIRVHSAGKLQADTEEESGSSSRVYFWGEAMVGTWRGIYVERGGDLAFNGGYSGASVRKVRLYGIHNSYSGIIHLGGSSSYIGKLEVNGTRFLSGRKGVYITAGDTTTEQYYSSTIQITNCEFDGVASPIYGYNILTHDGVDLLIDCNNIDDFGSVSDTHGIYLSSVYVNGRIILYNNELDGGTDYSTTWAIRMYNVRHGDLYDGHCEIPYCTFDHIPIVDNRIGQNALVSNGIYISRWRDTSSGDSNHCIVGITGWRDGSDNYLSRINVTREGIYADHGSSEEAACPDPVPEYPDVLEISKTIVVNESDTSSYFRGINISNMSNTGVSPSTVIDYNRVQGFSHCVYLPSSVSDVTIKQNIFGFLDNTYASRAMLYLSGTSNSSIDVGETIGNVHYGNCFGDTTRTYGHINGTAGAGQYLDCTSNDWNGSTSGSGTLQINPALSGSCSINISLGVCEDWYP